MVYHMKMMSQFLQFEEEQRMSINLFSLIKAYSNIDCKIWLTQIIRKKLKNRT